MKSRLLLAAHLALMLSNVNAQVTLTATGTGRTTGHIANLTLTNSGNKAETVTIPQSVIPSDGMHQGFIVTTPIEVRVPPNSTSTTPITGYCTDANLPAPEEGIELPGPGTWDPTSPLIPVVDRIIRVTTEYQNSSQFTTPFNGDPQSEIVQVVQDVIWIHTATPTSPYTLDDLCDRTMTLFTTTTGKPVTSLTPAEQQAIDYGTLQLIDAVTKVGERAGIPAFQPTPAPPAVSHVTDAPPSTHPNIANTITVTGTGRTTGHIADLNVSNPTDNPVTVQIGNGPAYIPAPNPAEERTRDANQGFVTPGIPAFTLGPGGTMTIPIDGFCADIHVPPPGAGSKLPDVPNWVSAGPFSVPTPPSPIPGSTVPEFVYIPTSTAMSLSETVDLLGDIPSRPAGPSGVPCPDGQFTVTPFIPGTSNPVPIPLNPGQHPGAAVPLLLDALSAIASTYDDMQSKGMINTPFSGNPAKEREAVIQQTFWRYSSALDGKTYEKNQFKAMTYQQFEQNSGKSVEKLPEPEQEKLEVGVDDFWNTFQAVGTEAKILPTVPALPTPAPTVDEFWDGYDAGDTKPKGTGTDTPNRPSTDPPQITVPSTDPPVLTGNDACDCGKVSFKATLVFPYEKIEAQDFTTELVSTGGGTKSAKIIVDATAQASTGADMSIDITNLVVTCGKCKNKECKKSEPTVTITYGELENDNSSNSVTSATITKDGSNYIVKAVMPEGTKDVGFFITVAYTCSDNACGEVPCDKKFLLRVKRKGVCECGETYWTPKVKVGKTEEEFTLTGAEFTWREKVSKDDVINIEVDKAYINPECKGCGGNCMPENITYTIYGENISGVKTRAGAKPVKYNPKMATALLKSEKITGDKGDAVFTITINHTCANASCDPVNCERTYTLRFPRK